MAIQPERPKFPFFLCNEDSVQFYILERQGSGSLFRLAESSPLSWENEGRQYLWNFLHASSSDSFWSMPDIIIDATPVDITGFLGAGASALVYSGTFKGDECVVKRFRPSHIGILFASFDLVHLPFLFSLLPS